MLKRSFPLYSSLWLCAIAIIISACASEERTTEIESTSIPPTQKVPSPTKTDEPSMPSLEPTSTPTQEAFVMNIEGFARGDVIPSNFACTGENLSPAITWNEPPGDTESFALLFDDPDAPGGSWVHWLLFNIPSASRNLKAEMPDASQIEDGTLAGANSWGNTSYGGPCPPEGSTHEYLFILYALDTNLTLETGASKADLLSAIEGHIVAQSEYTGLFSR